MPRRKIVRNAADLPDMTSEEAAEFWDSHEVGLELIHSGREDPDVQAFARRLAERPAKRAPRQPKAAKPTSIRLDADLERRLRAVAERKQVPYQTMLKDFVRERLYEEEKRLKIV